MTHQRKSTQEKIMMAITSSLNENTDPIDDVGPEWACLQCTFVNSINSPTCAMCMVNRPEFGVPAAGASDQASKVKAPVMYGKEAPPSASQPAKRKGPTKVIPRNQHRRMTTEEQISLAIQQTIETKEDGDGMLEMFQSANKGGQDPQHRRLSTEEQINQAIQLTEEQTKNATENQSADNADVSQPGHQRTSTEDQILSAIDQSVMSGEAMSTEDQINAAIASAGIGLLPDAADTSATGHKRMTTAEQIARAIEFSGTTDDSAPLDTFSTGVPMPKLFFPQSRVQEFVEQVIENPEQHMPLDPNPGFRLEGDALFICSRLIGNINDRKQEINRLRIQLNQERQLNQDLHFELQVMFDKCAGFEKSLQQQQEEVEAMKKKAQEEAQRLIEKAVDIEETLEPTVEERGHRHEPSYGGIRELFADEEDFSVEKKKQKTEHARAPTYGGIREMFMEVNAESKPKDKSMKRMHEREPSYQGMVDMFTRSDQKDDKEQDEDNEKTPMEQDVSHGRKASYGGIRDMFHEEDDEPKDDDERGGEADEKKDRPKTDRRNISYGGIREMFAEEDDDIGNILGDGDEENAQPKEELAGTAASQVEEAPDAEASDIPKVDTLSHEITASFQVLWNLLVEKVHHPEKYLPVEDVAVEHREGKWIRHMFLTSMQIVMTEEICINEEDYIITFVDNNYPDLEIVNKIETTDDPKKQRVLFYKRNRVTGVKIPASQDLSRLFHIDLHFLSMRAAQKMAQAMHAREPSYGGVTSWTEAIGHAREDSYGGVGDLVYNGQIKPHQSRRHTRDLSYGGIRNLFEEQDTPHLMAKLQEEVFRVMDYYEWSEITKGMVVQEVEEALGFELKPHHKRYIKITIMRIIDGKLKLECFAGENIKSEVVQVERDEIAKQKRSSIGGVGSLAAINEGAAWKKKEEELDHLYTKAQERELDQLYDKAHGFSKSAQAVIGGGFKGRSKIERDNEKERARKTKQHTRNVSYGGVRYSEDTESSAVLDEGPEVDIVQSTTYVQQMQELTDEVDVLRKENLDLKQFTENMRVSKMLLVQSCSDEIERLRAIISELS